LATALPGGDYIQVSGINSNGDFVGTPFQSFQAVLFDGTPHDLGVLPGASGSSAAAINASGEVAGSSGRDAFLYDGTMHDLGTIPGRNESIARDINDAGAVVGYAFPNPSSNYSPSQAAFLWTSGSGMVDLNSLINPAGGWLLTEADAINNAGQIAGLGLFGGKRHAFLLTPVFSPVPEPGSFILALVGIAILCAWRGCRPILRPQGTWRHEVQAVRKPGVPSHKFPPVPAGAELGLTHSSCPGTIPRSLPVSLPAQPFPPPAPLVLTIARSSACHAL
jgi:probable HAF family extracellular repeat protein